MFDDWFTSAASIGGEDVFDPSQWQQLFTDNCYQYIFDHNRPVYLSDEWTSSNSSTDHDKQWQCVDHLHLIPFVHLQRETPGETTQGETTTTSLGDPLLSPPSLEPLDSIQDFIPPSQKDNPVTTNPDSPPPAVVPH